MASGQWTIGVQEFEREWRGWSWQQKACVLFVADEDGERVFETSCGPRLEQFMDMSYATTKSLIECRDFCEAAGREYWISTTVLPALRRERSRQLDLLCYGN